MMRRIAGIFLTVLAAACTVQQDPVMISDRNIATPEKEDDEQHELIVLDPGFESWFAASWSPAKDRTQQYYDNWNDRYVQAWNYKATHPGYARFFNSTIDYDMNEDYGMEVSRKLYYYFRWVELKLNIPILDFQRPRGII